MEKIECENCKFWDKLDPTNEDDYNGWCKKCPPKIGVRSADDDDVFLEQFPIIQSYEWCGSFEPKDTDVDAYKQYIRQALLDAPIEIFDFSTRTINCLHRGKIKTINELISHSEIELFRIKNVGKQVIYEIITKLKAINLKLKD